MTQFTDFGDPKWLAASDVTFDMEHGRQIQEVVEAYTGIGYVAGGAARYILLPRAPEPLDIDVFLFSSQFDASPLKELGYDLAGGVERAPAFSRDPDELRVQVVRPDPGHPKRKGHGMALEVLSSFTFTTEQAAVWEGAEGFAGLLSVEGRESTESRILSNNLISNPILSMFRLNKYGQKKYAVSMDMVMEIASALRDLTDDEYDAAMLDALSMVS